MCVPTSLSPFGLGRPSHVCFRSFCFTYIFVSESRPASRPTARRRANSATQRMSCTEPKIAQNLLYPSRARSRHQSLCLRWQLAVVWGKHSGDTSSEDSRFRWEVTLHNMIHDVQGSFRLSLQSIPASVSCSPPRPAYPRSSSLTLFPLGNQIAGHAGDEPAAHVGRWGSKV